MTVPFRVGVMQLTMEPLEEMLESARVMDEAGLDTIWLAEAYPWWRKHGMEAKSSTVLAGMIARETKRLTVGWGIISPYTRHPVQAAMDARLVQEAAGPGRFIAGFGTSKIFLNNTKQGGPPKVTRPLATMRDSVEIMRGVLGGERFEYDGKVFSADIPALSPDAHVPRWNVPVYVAGHGAADAAARRRDRRRPADAVDHDARLRALHARQRQDRRREGGPRSGLGRRRLHGRRLDPRDRPRRGPRRRARDRRHVPRQQGAEHPGLGRHAARPREDRPGGDPAGRARWRRAAGSRRRRR